MPYAAIIAFGAIACAVRYMDEGRQVFGKISQYCGGALYGDKGV